MAVESQIDFSGGLNTRSPAHLIGANQLTELQNVDLSHNDLRGEYGTKSGGESEFYYEAASAWVSAAGFSAAETILDWPSKFTGTGTVSLVASGTSSKIIFTSANHGLSNTDIVQFSISGSGSPALPGNISASTNYFIKDKTDNTFYVSTSSGGTNVTFSSTGNGTLTWSGAYTGSNEIDITANVNYFSGSPNAIIGDGTTIEIGSNITVSVFARTQGIHGANSYVEYNDDLYITRSSFTVTADSTNASDVLTTGTDTNKLQIGDEFVNIEGGTITINTGSYIKSINTTNSTVTLSAPAIATASAETYTVDAIISKYVDGATAVSYRSGVNQPEPVIEYEKHATSAYNLNRDGSHSDAWYGANDPIPFQYGLAEYDETGVESTMAEMTDSNIGTVGGDKFPTASGNVDEPQYISISGLDKYTATTATKGRFALYRVGGTSAFIKRCDNLFLDSDLSVATTASSDTLTVTLGTAKDTFQYKVKWYTYNQGSAAAYRYYNASTGYVYPFDISPGGTIIRAFSGETEYKNSSSGNLTFGLDGSGSTHYTDIFVLMKIPGELIEREYVCRAITHYGADAVSSTGVDYIDFNRADALTDIQPIEEVTTPVRSLNGLIESSNLFFAFKDNRLYVSDYGNPNSWPESGFLDFDQNITGLGTLGSELVVFTEYGMYRVFGSNPSLLKKVQIPTTEGVKAGTNKTITKFQSGIFFAGLNGICFYNGQAVTRITQSNLSTFSLPDSTSTNNHGGYLEDTYFLLGTSGTGYKLDVKGTPILSRTTQNASNLFFRGSDNTLYADTGTIGDPTGTRQNFTATTRKFSGGDINAEKLFFNVALTAQSFTGTVNVLVDGTQTDTFSVGTEVTDLDRTFYLGEVRPGNGIQVQLSSCTGQVNKINVNYEDSNSLNSALFASVKIKYIGTPTVAVTLDGVANIAATTLSAPTGAVGEATLYFLSMSTGLTPHLKETNNESAGRVLGYSYTSTGV